MMCPWTTCNLATCCVCAPVKQCLLKKSTGFNVTRGTINGTDVLVMTAERVGAETLLAKIVGLVSSAQRSRAPIQGLADVVAGYFVPAVVAVAAIAFIYNAVGVPIAAGILFPAFGVLLSPIFAAAAMNLSSVSVISNALRLRRIKL